MTGCMLGTCHIQQEALYVGINIHSVIISSHQLDLLPNYMRYVWYVNLITMAGQMTLPWPSAGYFRPRCPRKMSIGLPFRFQVYCH